MSVLNETLIQYWYSFCFTWPLSKAFLYLLKVTHHTVTSSKPQFSFGFQLFKLGILFHTYITPPSIMYTAEIIAVTSHKRFKLTAVRDVLVSESRLQLSYYHYYAVFYDGVGIIIITCNFWTCHYVVSAFKVGAGNAADLP
jgi:hypothetical protein